VPELQAFAHRGAGSLAGSGSRLEGSGFACRSRGDRPFLWPTALCKNSCVASPKACLALAGLPALRAGSRGCRGFACGSSPSRGRSRASLGGARPGSVGGAREVRRRAVGLVTPGGTCSATKQDPCRITRLTARVPYAGAVCCMQPQLEAARAPRCTAVQQAACPCCGLSARAVRCTVMQHAAGPSCGLSARAVSCSPLLCPCSLGAPRSLKGDQGLVSPVRALRPALRSCAFVSRLASLVNKQRRSRFRL